MHIVKIYGTKYFVDICLQHQDERQGREVSIRDTLIYMGLGTFVSTQYLLVSIFRLKSNYSVTKL